MSENFHIIQETHFTALQISESFGEGNSDKLCDYIAESIVDYCLEQD
jgi:S-adenosylmethionine synthetase